MTNHLSTTTTSRSEANQGNLVQCDVCGVKKDMMDFGYIGPKDPENDSCDPFAGVTGGWLNICGDCYHD